ncbi:ribosomal protein L7/L12 [Mycolicibacterium iranicum]|uniref:50S ribosomal protein L12 n=1 Tax=Mycolicibacterium iranicum TaxID=912594 RepID=A0A178LN72_MYCIR|nr:ribosomal protein L7/L12 [Mycolicibacterium iranicum]OAN32610.1 50S ribosomal protein L12 [Mycolicibacterium iranicum]
MGLFGRSDNADDVDDGGLRRRVEELERRVAQLEWALRGAGPHAEAAAPQTQVPSVAGPPVSPEVVQLALAGKKIEAIKVLREQTGLGLKESKDIVDGLAP